jgi:hypothetical protein
MGRSFVAHPSDGKLAVLVGDVTFGWWACLGMMARGLVFVRSAPPHWCFSFCVKVVLVFVGMVNFGVWIDLEWNGREEGLFYFRESMFEKGEAGEEMAQKLFRSFAFYRT